MTVPARANQTGRQWRFGPIFGALWLIYLVFPLNDLLERSTAVRVGGIVLLVAFGVLFLGAFWVLRNGKRLGEDVPAWRAWLPLTGMIAMAVVLSAMIGTGAFGTTIYISVLAVMTLPTLQSVTLVVAMLAAVEVSPRIIDGWEPESFFGFQLVVSAAAAWGISQVFRRNHELAQARQQLNDLAVVAERERVSRDVHDILGHSLTVITVKAQLASRLLELDPSRARDEIDQVEALAREALADVRSTVGGIRRVDIAVELGNARSALVAAGIEAGLPTNADHVPLRNRELFGWVLREAVTNVVRHSRAGRCEVSVDTDRITVTDDGVGVASGAFGGGNGLRGLEARVNAADATLTLGRGPTGGFRVEVSAT